MKKNKVFLLTQMYHLKKGEASFCQHPVNKSVKLLIKKEAF